ncbi:exopolysaccharide transport family protein [Hyphomicrobium sp. CS1GBMeth3]|uniref:GumC family protein n=1 Tax=Hyphomicrobium sp. CS1GBMeth3 TaxID=1892845 RepID=UPI000930C774|nr:exopolysaccharide transport family protein [Hyphomicrobium sp. CS1GBMeth3]
MTSSTLTRPDDIDLGALWQVAVRSLPWLALVALALGAATYAVLGMVAPRYVSETQLAIESKSSTNPFTDPSRGAGSDNVSVRMDREAINTHVRAMMSTDLGEAIVREMKLAERAEFNGALGPTDRLTALLRRIGIGVPRAGESPEDRALDAYFKRLEVYSPKESRFIGIRFTSIDPELAAAVANRIAETYRGHLARQSLIETDEVQKAIEPKIAKLAEEAAAAEATVEKFRGEANIFKGGQQTGLNEQQLAELNAELSRVTGTRSEAEARAKQAREMQALGSAETLADVQRSPLIQSLVQSRVRVERQISELSAALLPGHPRMRQLVADLKGLKSQIDAEVAKIVDGLAKEAKVAALREEAIQKSIADIKARIVTAGPEEARLRSLEADARSKRAELDRLRAQYEANRVRADDARTIPAEAHIVSGARPSSTPVFPKKMQTALLVAVAALMIGFALVVTRGLLSDAHVAGKPAGHPPRGGNRDRRRRDRAQPVLPVPVPRIAPPKAPLPMTATAKVDPPPRPVAPLEAANANAGPEQPAAKHAAGSVPEIASHEAMAARIGALHKSGQTGTRTLLTGAADVFSLANEAADICRRLAADGASVILVDWSLNGSGIAEPLGAPAWPGFAELIDGRARFEDVVRALHDSEVHLIPCGRGVEDADEPLDSDSLNFLLDALDDVYEHIVVVARAEPAHRLFEAIQGRFDCGITLVIDEAQRARVQEDGNGSFLGFDVEGIALFALDRCERVARTPARGRGKLARVG